MAFLRSWLGLSRPAARRRTTLGMERLEDRDVPATIRSFDVWTQNAQLRPPDIFGTEELISISLLNPPLGVTLGLAELVYSSKVQNTDIDNEDRAYLLAGQAKNGGYDIVAAQEVFQKSVIRDSYDMFVDEAASEFNAIDGPGESGFEVSSGLVTLVNNQFVASSPLNQVFTDEGDFEDLDWLAQKGFSLTAVQLGASPDEFVYVVNTHLKTGQDQDDKDTRANQLDQLAAFVNDPRNVDARHPILFMGDFNIIADDDPDSEYASMLAALGNPEDPFQNDPQGREFLTSDPERNAYNHFWNGGTSRTRLDHILIRQGSDFGIEVAGLTFENEGLENVPWFLPNEALGEFQDWEAEVPSTRSIYPSDHFGLSAQLRLTRHVTLSATGELTVEGGSGDSDDYFTIDCRATGEIEVGVTVPNPFTESGFTTHYRSFAPGTVTSILIKGEGGNDRVNVAGNPGVPLRVEGGAGDDEFNVSQLEHDLANVTGATVTFDGGDDHDSLTVYDGVNAVNSTYTIDGRTVTGPFSTTFHYNAAGNNTLEELTLNAGERVSTINVQAVPAGMKMNINGGGQQDRVYVGNAQNRLEDIVGTLTIDGEGGAVEDLTLNDQGSSAGRTYSLGFDGKNSTVTVSGLGTIFYRSMGELTVNGGSGLGDTLVGLDAQNSWAIRSQGGGEIGARTHFTRMENLTGGSHNDTFAFHSFGTILGRVDGAAGSDELDFSNRAGGVTVNLPARTASPLSLFAGIESAVGTSSADTLIGDDGANTWSLTATGTDTVSRTNPQPGDPGVFSFESFENLTGGAGNDLFAFADGRTLTGTIAGGGGGGSSSDTLDLSAFTTGRPAQTWTVTASGTGNLNGVTTFTGIENLTGGAAADTFAMGNNSSLAGKITGGNGTDTLDYSQRTTAITIDLALMAAPGITNGFTEIDSLVGTGRSDTLLGFNAPASWYITGVNVGTVGPISFSGFENLTGNALPDTFYFTGTPLTARVAGTITGGGGTSIDTLDYSAYTGLEAPGATVNLATQTATATGGIAGIERFTGGGGADTLIGENKDTTWNVTADNTGTLSKATGMFYFSSVENLSGGTMADKFVLAAQHVVSGTVAGGSGADKLDFSGRSAGVAVNLAVGLATGVGGGLQNRVSGIENVTGSQWNDVLFGDGASNILLGLAGKDTINGGDGRDLLIGGTGEDSMGGGLGEDIWVGGSTAHDGNDASLAAIMAEWLSARTFGERMLRIRGLVPDGLNGSVYLDGPQIINDFAMDTFLDNLGPDWIFA